MQCVIVESPDNSESSCRAVVAALAPLIAVYESLWLSDAGSQGQQQMWLNMAAN